MQPYFEPTKRNNLPPHDKISGMKKESLTFTGKILLQHKILLGTRCPAAATVSPWDDAILTLQKKLLRYLEATWEAEFQNATLF